MRLWALRFRRRLLGSGRDRSAMVVDRLCDLVHALLPDPARPNVGIVRIADGEQVKPFTFEEEVDRVADERRHRVGLQDFPRAPRVVDHLFERPTLRLGEDITAPELELDHGISADEPVEHGAAGRQLPGVFHQFLAVVADEELLLFGPDRVRQALCHDGEVEEDERRLVRAEIHGEFVPESVRGDREAFDRDGRLVREEEEIAQFERARFEHAEELRGEESGVMGHGIPFVWSCRRDEKLLRMSNRWRYFGIFRGVRQYTRFFFTLKNRLKIG